VQKNRRGVRNLRKGLSGVLHSGRRVGDKVPENGTF
jgi:hypothetical protein